MSALSPPMILLRLVSGRCAEKPPLWPGRDLNRNGGLLNQWPISLGVSTTHSALLRPSLWSIDEELRCPSNTWRMVQLGLVVLFSADRT